MRESLKQLTLVRIREFWREPEAVFWTLLFPILLSVGLGIAFRNRPAEVVKVAVVGQPADAAITLGALRQSRAVAPESLDAAAARFGLRTGRIAIVVRSGANGAVEYEYDDTRPDARIARLIVDDVLQRGRGRADVVAIAERHIREPGSRYIDFVIPGLLGMGLMGNGIWLVGFAVVDMRRRKLLKRLMATPMSRVEFLASFGIPRFILVVIEVGLLLAFAILVFGVPLRGSIAQLVLICLLGALAFVALGLLIASRPKTIEGASGLMNLAIVPMWIFSGVFFSAENFPERDPAVHSGASTHRAERRAAGQHAPRRGTRRGGPGDRDHPRVDGRQLRVGVAAVPLALIAQPFPTPGVCRFEGIGLSVHSNPPSRPWRCARFRQCGSGCEPPRMGPLCQPEGSPSPPCCWSPRRSSRPNHEPPRRGRVSRCMAD